MAQLESPGVQVTVIDESFYTPSAPGTVPMVFVASAQDKRNPSGTTALGTTAANAGKVWLITSQRDLTDTFGTPVFYTDASANPQHGNELNEYGLQAAYSVLGASSRAYIVRADLDLAALTPSSDAPNGNPESGTFWVDTDASVFGIKEWNATTEKFTVKTPIVLNDDSPADQFNGSYPNQSVGSIGDYCMVISYTKGTTLYVKMSDNTWEIVQDNIGPTTRRVQISPHYTYPNFTTSTVTGSVWVTTTTPANGANWSVKYYNGSTQAWTTVSAPIYAGRKEAIYALDPNAGGKNIPLRTVFIDSNPENAAEDTASFKLYQRNSTGATVATGNVSNTLSTDPTYTFSIRATSTGSNAWSAVSTATITPSTSTTKIASLIPAAIASLNIPGVTASFNTTTSKLTITHANGGDIELNDGTGTPFSLSGFVVGTDNNIYTPPTADTGYEFYISNWKPLVYEATNNAPFTDPADGRLWYSSVVDEVDVLIHDGNTWVSYFDEVVGTDPAGPLVQATEPVNGDRSDGGNLVTGDMWIDTADLENYGKNIYIYDSTITVGSKWVLQDTTDQETPSGWLFADARWATSGGSKEPSTIVELIGSGYLDPDAPDPALYPKGMKLWNTRRSGFNVKKYITGHLNLEANDGQNRRFGNQSMSNYVADRWVSQYTTAANGSGQFGRKAQRAQVVNAFKELIDANQGIRDTDTLNFNLIVTPGYPEAIQNMVAFNNDRGITAFVVGDTPFRLQPTGTALNAWGLNSNGALDNGDDGAVSYDEYMAMYYPSGYTNDNTGNYIVVPPSHMMLRTIINSDAKSYPWFAPAGTRRGGVDNATAVGYLDGSGEFRSVALHNSLRDVLDDVKINPIATLTGVGILAYGQRTRARNASSLDRINVSRLVCYLRRQLDIMARPFLFEPNDAQTRREIKAAAESLMLELVGQRALYDFIVVCDETNNTPARIDRSELYLDIAIEPVKAVEFIYIPLRLKNTGDIAAGL
jgi:hypothetical protein